MIVARQVSKEYRDPTGGCVQVLKGLDLLVGDGELVSVVGPSGSGKSTLLHLLGGLDAEFEGEVEVAGVKLNGLDDRKLARFRNVHVGFVFQSFHLIPNLSALDNVLLPSYFGTHDVNGPPVRRAMEVLDRVGLAHKASRSPARLSGGERQRVAIARALFVRPKVLFCDEPTGNLDAVTGREVIALFEELHREGLTILVVTHEDRVSRVAERVLRLGDGRLELEPEGRGA